MPLFVSGLGRVTAAVFPDSQCAPDGKVSHLSLYVNISLFDRLTYSVTYRNIAVRAMSALGRPLDTLRPPGRTSCPSRGLSFRRYSILTLMKFTVGTKQEMTQVFTEAGRVEPVTVIKIAPMTVTQVKTVEKDGYTALQFGFAETTDKHVNKAQKPKGLFSHYIEFRTDGAPELEVGAVLSPDVFVPGDVVTAAGLTKGKGFQGGVKRHGFKGGRRSHGQKHSEREPGSIGGGGRAGGRVVKGMRMAGRMGGERVTVKNLRIVQIDPANGIMLVSGAVPGRRGTLIEIVGK